MKEDSGIHVSNEYAPHRYSTTMEKVLVILEYLVWHAGTDGAGIAQISRDTRMEKAAVYRAVNTLMVNGYLVKRNAAYTVSSKILALAGEYLERLDVRRVAHPYLKRMAEKTGELAFIAIMEQSEMVIIEKVEGSKDLRIFSHIGSRFPLHCAASGKLFLAFMDMESRSRILKEIKFHQYTQNTIKNRVALQKHLEEVRRRGTALNDYEQDQQKRAIAAPIFDSRAQIIAAICVAGVGSSLTDDKMRDIEVLLHEAGSAISQEMGYRMGSASRYWERG